MAWDTIYWEAEQATAKQNYGGQYPVNKVPTQADLSPTSALLNASVRKDQGEGAVVVEKAGSEDLLFYVGRADGPGDGTVPVRSGRDPGVNGVKACYHLNLDDVGHEGAYRNSQAQMLTLHAILKIAQTVTIRE